MTSTKSNAGKTCVVMWLGLLILGLKLKILKVLSY